MTQIQEPIPLIHNDPFMPQMCPNLSMINPMSIPQIMPAPLNQPIINGSYPLPMPMQMTNNVQNPPQNQQSTTDTSKYKFLIFILIIYRKT